MRSSSTEMNVPSGADPELPRALVLFYWMGYVYRGRALSLAKVAAALDAMEQRGELPPRVAVSIVSVKRAAAKVRHFFGQQFDCGEPAPLFRCDGQAFVGLSELGEEAWVMTRSWMQKNLYVTEPRTPPRDQLTEVTS
jgi:hypothetical protein